MFLQLNEEDGFQWKFSYRKSKKSDKKLVVAPLPQVEEDNTTLHQPVMAAAADASE